MFKARQKIISFCLWRLKNKVTVMTGEMCTWVTMYHRLYKWLLDRRELIALKVYFWWQRESSEGAIYWIVSWMNNLVVSYIVW